MASNKLFEYAVDEVSLNSFGSATYEAIFNLSPRDFNAVGYLEWANMTGNGQISAELSFAATSSVHNIWANPLTFAAVSAVSSASHAFYSSADDQVKPLLPKCRAKLNFVALSSSTVTFTDVVLRLMVED